jgi:hypothetical protein
MSTKAASIHKCEQIAISDLNHHRSPCDKIAYCKGKYRGRIIIDFDQTKNEARLALSSVMDQLVSRGAVREAIQYVRCCVCLMITSTKLKDANWIRRSLPM